MVVFTFTGKQRIRTLLFLLLILSGFGLYRYAAVSPDASGSNGSVCAISGLYRTVEAVSLMSSADRKDAEIFDISQGRVVKSIPADKTVTDEAGRILKSITGMNMRLKALPEKGHIVKIPFEPNIRVKNQWFDKYDINPVGKIHIVFPQEEAPYLFMLDQKERPYLFNFKGETDTLLKYLNFETE